MLVQSWPEKPHLALKVLQQRVYLPEASPALAGVAEGSKVYSDLIKQRSASKTWMAEFPFTPSQREQRWLGAATYGLETLKNH